MSAPSILRAVSRARITSFGPRNASRFSSTTAATGLPSSSSRRSWAKISAIAALSVGVYTLGVIYPPNAFSIVFPRAAPAPPQDPDSPESKAYTASLENTLFNLPFLLKLREAPDASEWYETRPYLHFPEERRVNNLAAGALRGPGKLAIPALIRAKRDESGSIVLVHVGRGLCGHDGIIHGGLLATLLDETLARTAISNLPEKIGVTAKLSLNYRAPTKADQFIVIRTYLTEVKGRRVDVKGRVEDLDGTLLVEAEATFVQPRYAKLLNTQQIRQAMGEPPQSDAPVLLADGQKLDPHHFPQRK